MLKGKKMNSGSFMSLVALHHRGPSPLTPRDAPLPHPSSLPGEVLLRKAAYSVPNLLGKVFITPHTFKTCLLPYKRKFKPQTLLLLNLRSWEGESNQISFSFPLQKSKLPFAYPYGYFASPDAGWGAWAWLTALEAVTHSLVQRCWNMHIVPPLCWLYYNSLFACLVPSREPMGLLQPS